MEMHNCTGDMHPCTERQLHKAGNGWAWVVSLCFWVCYSMHLHTRRKSWNGHGHRGVTWCLQRKGGTACCLPGWHCLRASSLERLWDQRPWPSQCTAMSPRFQWLPPATTAGLVDLELQPLSIVLEIVFGKKLQKKKGFRKKKVLEKHLKPPGWLWVRRLPL